MNWKTYSNKMNARLRFSVGSPYNAPMITVKDLGGPTRVARVLGLAAPSVHGWRNGIPADHCPALERESGGNFTVEQMRPDVHWHRVPDPAWPHPDGRPLIDVAKPAATTAA